MDLLKMNIKNVQAGVAGFGCPVTLSSTPSGSYCARAGLSRRELSWVDLINRYPSPCACLAAFIVSSAAEVMAGATDDGPAALLLAS